MSIIPRKCFLACLLPEITAALFTNLFAITASEFYIHAFRKEPVPSKEMVLRSREIPVDLLEIVQVQGHQQCS